MNFKNLIFCLVAFFVFLAIALPQLLGYFQEKRARADFEKRMSELEQRIEYQQQEIDELKSRRIVTPS